MHKRNTWRSEAVPRRFRLTGCAASSVNAFFRVIRGGIEAVVSNCVHARYCFVSFLIGSRMMRFLSSSLMMKRSVLASPSCLLRFLGMTTTFELSLRYALAVVIICSTIFSTFILDKIYISGFTCTLRLVNP